MSGESKNDKFDQTDKSIGMFLFTFGVFVVASSNVFVMKCQSN